MSRKDFLNSTRFSNFSTHSSFLNRICSGDETAWFEFHEKYVRMIRLVSRAEISTLTYSPPGQT